MRKVCIIFGWVFLGGLFIANPDLSGGGVLAAGPHSAPTVAGADRVLRGF